MYLLGFSLIWHLKKLRKSQKTLANKIKIGFSGCFID